MDDETESEGQRSKSRQWDKRKEAVETNEENGKEKA